MAGNELMKIMVGMGSIDDYESFVNAGADEIFVGYVPAKWSMKYGLDMPLNRREVLYYNVQIGSFSELVILRDMVKEKGVPVTITLNALQYERNQYEDLIQLIKECLEIGFDRFIVADYNFLQYYEEQELPSVKWIVSGEYGEMNEKILDLFDRIKVERVIFPRQTSLDEMRAMIQKENNLEYEAFVLNEKCHFTGAYCNTYHCDELCHMCMMEYRVDGPHNSIQEMDRIFALGYSGCGLCALWDLKDIGVHFLKIVSRGNASDETEEDICNLKMALNLLDQSHNKNEYIKMMKEKLFVESGQCSGNCYYKV